ncbi:hypothetical protein I4U23_010991 [Adineta vaga]|nr:hypothetical protein I4U23_010991 [Adineta vaga]
MIWIRIFVLFSMVIFDQAVAQNVRSCMMSTMDGWQFQCATTTCLPYVTIVAFDILQCQSTCLGQTQCEAASFHQSTSSCQLFDHIVTQNNNMEAMVGTVTMTVISGTRTPSATSSGVGNISG